MVVCAVTTLLKLSPQDPFGGLDRCGLLDRSPDQVHIFTFSSILALVELSSKTRQVMEGLCLPTVGIGRLFKVTMASLLNLLQVHLAVELEVCGMMPLSVLSQLLFLFISSGSYVLHVGPRAASWRQKNFIGAFSFLKLQELFSMLWIIEIPSSLQRKGLDDPTHGFSDL